MTDGYTYKTYGTAKFYIPAGLYSIEETENLLVYIKAAKKQAEKSLERSMKPIYGGEHMDNWPFPTELPPALPSKPIPFNPENYEDAPWFFLNKYVTF
jgi:hypothetical protein